MKTHTNISLKNFNSFHIDEKAQQIIVFSNADEVKNYFNKNHTEKLNVLPIGEGSNILFTKDFDGTILKIENKGIEVVDDIGDHVWVKAAAGEKWDDLVEWAVEHNYGGIENLSLIPGTVGAAPVQNIGAYGVEFSQVFNSLEAVEISTGEWRSFYLQELEFDYRTSVFKHSLRNKYLITSVIIKLRKYPRLNIEYGELKKAARELSGKDYPDISDIRKAVIKIREDKLPDPAHKGNAGSFFKNPIIQANHFHEIIANYPELVAYPLENGEYKIAAAWLIEHTGLKGYIAGQAGVHKKHALILVNLGGAKGKEISDLATYIQQKVFEKFGILLEPEVLIL